MKKLILALSLTSTSLFAQEYPNEFTFEGVLETIGGYSNTNGNVLYKATNGIITTGTNANNWDNLKFVSLGGNFYVNQTFNLNTNDTFRVVTGLYDTVVFSSVGNMDNRSNIVVNGNISLSNVIVNNSHNNPGLGNKAIISLTESSYLRLSSPNGIVSGYGLDIHESIPIDYRVYNSSLNMWGFKTSGSHTSYIFFDVSSDYVLLPNFTSIYHEKGFLFWDVANKSSISFFAIESSSNAKDWRLLEYVSANTFDFKVFGTDNYFRVKMVCLNGKEYYSSVIVVNSNNNPKPLFYVDISGRVLSNPPNNQNYITQWSDGSTTKN